MKKTATEAVLAFTLAAGSIFIGACSEEPAHKRESFGTKEANATGKSTEEKDLAPTNSPANETRDANPQGGSGNETIALNGKDLYAQNCVSCHGALATSEHAGASATLIKNAINTVPDMSGLKSLSDAKIALIGGELQAITPASPVLALDGMKLYMDNCMGCHGPKPATTVDVKTIDAVKAARINIPDMAGNATPDNELAALLKYLIDP